MENLSVHCFMVQLGINASWWTYYAFEICYLDIDKKMKMKLHKIKIDFALLDYKIVYGHHNIVSHGSVDKNGSPCINFELW